MDILRPWSELISEKRWLVGWWVGWLVSDFWTRFWEKYLEFSFDFSHHAWVWPKLDPYRFSWPLTYYWLCTGSKFTKAYLFLRKVGEWVNELLGPHCIVQYLVIWKKNSLFVLQWLCWLYTLTKLQSQPWASYKGYLRNDLCKGSTVVVMISMTLDVGGLNCVFRFT